MVVAAVLWYSLKRIYNTLQLFLGTFVKTVNELSERAGRDAIITPDVVERFKQSL